MVTKPPSFNVNQNTFVEVPLKQTVGLQKTKDMRSERRVITPPVLPTPPLSGVWSIQQGSF
jgi:hypothetical protein